MSAPDDIGDYYEQKRLEAARLADELKALLLARPLDLRAIKRTREALERARYVGD